MAFDVGQYSKAIVAGLTAFGGSYSVALADGLVSTEEWVTVAVATLVATAGVFAVVNAPAPAVIVEDEPGDHAARFGAEVQ